MDIRILYKIWVTGRVQGVGFRWSTARVARSLGITGSVRNMADGSVYIEAEGSSVQLETFAEWCRKGPAHAHVEAVKIEIASPVEYTDFTIE